MITDYGFTWGPLEVTRYLIYRGRRALGVTTKQHKVEIIVSPQGNNIQVYLDNKKMEVAPE